jgi:predicted metal-dependent HD superfamily phosphohydrolase
VNSRATSGSRRPNDDNKRRGASRSAAPSDSTAADIDDHVPGAAEVAWTTHVSSDTVLFERLVARHRERQRRYHRIEHVEAVLEHVSALSATESIDDLGAVVAAALYHDAIYESQHPANERASARLARRDLTELGWEADRVECVARMIEGTNAHLDPSDADTAVLFDADLAILGAEPDAYQVYVGRVRDEYGHLDDAEWSAGRSAVLAGFLERPHIYATAGGRERWEAAARANITAELAPSSP